MPHARVEDVPRLHSGGRDRVEYFLHGPIPAFGVRVTKKGRKSWFLYYRDRERLRRVTLGRWPMTSAAEAQATAATILRYREERELKEIKATPFRLRSPSTPPRRARRNKACIVHEENDVGVRGEPLDAVIWQGRQWAVTAHGLECRDGTYAIKASRLAEDLPRYSWPEHMSEKEWVDVEDFATAWLVALSVHGIHQPPAVVLDALKRLPTHKK